MTCQNALNIPSATFRRSWDCSEDTHIKNLLATYEEKRSEHPCEVKGYSVCGHWMSISSSSMLQLESLIFILRESEYITALFCLEKAIMCSIQEPHCYNAQPVCIPSLQTILDVEQAAGRFGDALLTLAALDTGIFERHTRVYKAESQKVTL